MNVNNPFKLPIGTIRALIALMLVAAIIYFTAAGIDIPGELFGFVGAIIGFYFAHRANQTEK